VHVKYYRQLIGTLLTVDTSVLVVIVWGSTVAGVGWEGAVGTSGTLAVAIALAPTAGGSDVRI
jgi:hypothetical protein